MLQSVRAQLILLGDLGQPDLLKKLLSALEQDDVLRPTHWGTSAYIRDPYDRGSLLNAVAQAEPGALVAHVLRMSPVRYEAWWYPEQGTLSSVQLESQPSLSTGEPEALCEAVSRLAALLPLDYGHVDLRFEQQDSSTFMQPGNSYHHLGAYGRKGPDVLFPRTFFGPRLVKMMGGEVALHLPGTAFELLENGTWQLDLVPAPWSSDPTSLKRAQASAREALFPTGIFVQQISRWKQVPGPRWQPLLGDVAAHGEQGPPYA